MYMIRISTIMCYGEKHVTSSTYALRRNFKSKRKANAYLKRAGFKFVMSYGNMSSWKMDVYPEHILVKAVVNKM